jgi:hypothetical protein
MTWEKRIALGQTERRGTKVEALQNRRTSFHTGG